MADYKPEAVGGLLGPFLILFGIGVFIELCGWLGAVLR